MGRYLGEKGAKFILDLIRPLEAKLNTIAEGANQTVVDSALSTTSTNPVQNKVINKALAGKAERYHDHGCYIDGIEFDTSSNLSRLGTCTTASYDTAKEVTISGFEETEESADAILYIEFTASYEGASNDTHTICINSGEQLVIYYKDEVLDWEAYFSNYLFCDGQIHQFRYHYHPMGSRLELIAVEPRAVANNYTTTDPKISFGAPLGKELREDLDTLSSEVSKLDSKVKTCLKVKKIVSQNISISGLEKSTVTLESGTYLITQAHPTGSEGLYYVRSASGYAGKIIPIIEDPYCAMSIDSNCELTIELNAGGGNFRWWNIVKLSGQSVITEIG